MLSVKSLDQLFTVNLKDPINVVKETFCNEKWKSNY